MGNRNFTETMDRGKALAVLARNRGLPTGKSAKGWNRRRSRPDPEAGTFERLWAVATAAWRNTREEVEEDYRRAVYPERYDCPESWR